MSFQLGSYLFILLDIAPRIAPTNWSGPILAMSGARRSQEHATEANVKRLPPFFLCLFLSFSLSLSLAFPTNWCYTSSRVINFGKAHRPTRLHSLHGYETSSEPQLER